MQRITEEHYPDSVNYFIPENKLEDIRMIEGIYYYPYTTWNGDKILLPIYAVVTVDGEYSGTRSNWGRDYPSLQDALDDDCIEG